MITRMSPSDMSVSPNSRDTERSDWCDVYSLATEDRSRCSRASCALLLSDGKMLEYSLFSERRSQMKGIGRSCCGAACLVAVSSLGASRAGAWGALAIGAPLDRSQVITAGVVGKPTEDEARKAAFESCRATKSGSDQARAAC